MNAPCEVALERPQRFCPGLAFGLASAQVVHRRRVDACLRDGDPVKREVELAVALAIQAMALLFARGGIQRSDAGKLRELGVRVEAFDPGDLRDQLGGCQASEAGQGEQPRRLALDEDAQLALEFIGVAREL